MNAEIFLEIRYSGNVTAELVIAPREGRQMDEGTLGREPSHEGNKELSFRALMAVARRRAAIDGVSSSVIASNEAALRSFARAHGCNDNDVFTPVVGLNADEFQIRLRAYEENTSKSATTIASYRSRLRTWNATARALIQGQTFETAQLADILLPALLAFLEKNPGINKTEVAQSAGIDQRVLYYWTHPGKGQPTSTSANKAATARLESILGLSPDSLTSKLSSRKRTGRKHADVEAERKRRFGKMPLNTIRYRPEVLPEKIKEFFTRLTALKTTSRVVRNVAGASIKRTDRVWRVVSEADIPVPAAVMMEERWATFTGWMMLPNTLEGAVDHVKANCRWTKRVLSVEEATALAPYFIGRGLPSDELTPAHLVDPELLGEFIEFLKKRNGSVLNIYIRDAMALIEPKRGFLAQQVECAWDYVSVGIPSVDQGAPNWKAAYATAAEAWVAQCASWTEELRGLLPFAKHGRRGARDKLAPILDQKDLIGVINTIIDSHAQGRPAGKLVPGWSGSVLLAVWVRDQLLLRMLASNPLRNRNFREMRHLEHPTPQDRGNLYRSQDGGWRLLYQPHEFKNERGAAKETYDVPVPADIHPLIDLYLTKARPILLRSAQPTDRVFISRDGDPFNDRGLGAVVLSLTGRHVQDDVDILGFRTHAFRHIIATAWLRAHPEDYLTVAQILHDSLRTVLENYAHNKPGDGLTLYSSWLSTKMRPLPLDPSSLG